MAPKRIPSWLGLCCTIIGFAVAIFAFVQVQVLQAYPFYEGVYGNELLLPGITYTVGLEIFALLAFAGLLLWSYSRAEGGRGRRLGKAFGNSLLFFGILVALIVYAETHLLWGEIIPGVHVWQGLQGGGGYPWGTEQVAYNTCFISSAVPGDCTFLNYDDLFWLAIICAIVGFIMRYSLSNDLG